MSKIWGTVLLVTGFIACPCHLVITLPIIIGVLGGTGLGAFLSDNRGLVYGVATGYFIVGVAGGYYLWNRRKPKTGQANILSALGLGVRDASPPNRAKGRKRKPGSVSPL